MIVLASFRSRSALAVMLITLALAACSGGPETAQIQGCDGVSYQGRTYQDLCDSGPSSETGQTTICLGDDCVCFNYACSSGCLTSVNACGSAGLVAMPLASAVTTDPACAGLADDTDIAFPEYLAEFRRALPVKQRTAGAG